MRRSLCLFLGIGLWLAAIGADAATSLTDEFDGNDLASKWSWSNEPNQWDVGSTKKGWLTIHADPNRNLWAADDTSRLYQEIGEEPFDVETHLATEFDAPSCVAGLVVVSPADNNWVTLKFWGRGGPAQLQFQTKQNENGNGLTGNVGWAGAGGVADLYMRLTKEEDVYTAYYKEAENADWIQVGPTTFNLTPPLQVSLYAGVDGPAGKMLVQYEYFRDNLNPLAVDARGKLPLRWAALKAVR